MPCEAALNRVEFLRTCARDGWSITVFSSHHREMQRGKVVFRAYPGEGVPIADTHPALATLQWLTSMLQDPHTQAKDNGHKHTNGHSEIVFYVWRRAALATCATAAQETPGEDEEQADTKDETGKPPAPDAEPARGEAAPMDVKKDEAQLKDATHATGDETDADPAAVTRGARPAQVAVGESGDRTVQSAAPSRFPLRAAAAPFVPHGSCATLAEQLPVLVTPAHSTEENVPFPVLPMNSTEDNVPFQVSPTNSIEDTRATGDSSGECCSLGLHLLSCHASALASH